MFSSLRQRLMLSYLIVILLAMGLVAVTLQTALENYFLSVVQKARQSERENRPFRPDMAKIAGKIEIFGAEARRRQKT